LSRIKFSGRAAICLFIMAVSLIAVLNAFKWPLQTALFPMVIGTVMFFLSLATLILILTGKGESPGKQAPVDRQLSADVDEATANRATLVAFGWVIGFFALILFLGFPIAISLFVFCYAKFQGKEKWGVSLALTFFSWLIFWGLFIRLLHIPFEDGLLQEGLQLLGIGS